LDEASLFLKEKVASKVAYLPKEEIAAKYRDLIVALNPKWIITTNYDHILEHILGKHCFSIDVDDLFIQYEDLKPIYHIHGTRYNPKGMVLSDEDYLATLRPNDYRIQRLSFLLMESVPLFIGYSLNDMNIRVALDWKRNLYQRKLPVDPRFGITWLNDKIVQFVYTKADSTETIYEISKGNIQYTYRDLSLLLQTLCEKSHYYNESYEVNSVLDGYSFDINNRTGNIARKLNREFPVDASDSFGFFWGNGRGAEAVQYLKWYIKDFYPGALSSIEMMEYYIDSLFQMLCNETPTHLLRRNEYGGFIAPVKLFKSDLPVQVYGIIEESIFQAFKAKQENAELIENVFLGTSGIPKHIYSINYIESYYRDRFLELSDIANARGRNWFRDTIGKHLNDEAS